MGNCLVTKLQGTVDNIGLPKLGYLKLRINSELVGRTLRLPVFRNNAAGNDVAFILEGDVYHTTSAGEPISPAKEGYIGYLDSSFYCKKSSNKDAFIYYEVENIKHFQCVNDGTYIDGVTEIEEVSYIPNLNSIYFTAPNVKINVKDLKELPIIRDISLINAASVYGDVAEFNKFQTLQVLNINGNTQIRGNVESLGNLINLTTANISGAYTGDLKNLFDSWYSNGRRSGSVKVWTLTNSGLVYNGQPYSHRVWNVTFTSEGHTETNDDE